MAGNPKTQLARSPGASLALNSVSDLQQLADMLYKGGLTPPGIDSPAKVAAVVLAGLEVGLAPTQALSSIMLTNGRLSIYGDGALALVRACGQLEAIAEKVEGEGAARTGWCAIKRKGEPEKVFSFSMGQAEKAGLIERAKGKDGKGRGPWVSYPDRMLVMRARGFALRDVFPDVLRGLVTYEEVQDGAVVETEVKVVSVAGVPVEPRAAVDTATVVAAQGTVAPLGVSQIAATPIPQADATPPAAVAPQPQPAAGPVTDDQKEKFLELRPRVWASRGATDDDSRRAAWVAELGEHGFASVADMTSEQAEKVLDALWKKHVAF